MVIRVIEGYVAKSCETWDFIWAPAPKATRDETLVVAGGYKSVVARTDPRKGGRKSSDPRGSAHNQPEKYAVTTYQPRYEALLRSVH